MTEETQMTEEIQLTEGIQIREDEIQAAQEMLTFIDQSPTCYQAIGNLKERLVAAGFAERKEQEHWEITPGGSYYVTRNDSSLIAFRVPDREPVGFHIAAAHSDSPTFKIKEHPEMKAEEQYVRLNTEGYGGMIRSTWLDRPLSVAGRIAVEQEGQVVTRLVNVDRDLCVIPNVAIHMNRELNKGIEYNPQIDLIPLFAQVPQKTEEEKAPAAPTLMGQVAKAAEIPEENILGQDLFLYVRDKGRILGAAGEYVLSPRLDDLQCVYTAFRAFLDSAPQSYLNVCAVFDNEEVGSGTRQGADSTFLEDVLSRICEGLGYGEEKRLRMIADSFLVSADNAHAVHPNHPEKADPTNRPYLNGGIVIKYHGSQKYTTDAVTAAQMKKWCRQAGVPCQTYANRSDIAGGSTLGNISTAHVSVASVDIGLPQLAMHSAVETAGVKDTLYAIKMFREFYQEERKNING